MDRCSYILKVVDPTSNKMPFEKKNNIKNIKLLCHDKVA